MQAGGILKLITVFCIAAMCSVNVHGLTKCVADFADCRANVNADVNKVILYVMRTILEIKPAWQLIFLWGGADDGTGRQWDTLMSEGRIMTYSVETTSYFENFSNSQVYCLSCFRICLTIHHNTHFEQYSEFLTFN